MTRSAVLITGGGGRLGSALARRLAATGHAVTAVDLSFPSWLDYPALPVRCVQADVLSAGGGHELHRAIADCGVVVHLAGLHGLHLRQGASVADLWRSNVESTRRVTAAAVEAGVRRMVLASTTAVYGPGSAPGEPAAILDEARTPQPDNPYATSKLASESVMATAAGAGIEVVSLRLGRFFREDERSYQIRKLSTGLDLEDAIDAMEAVCVAEQVASGVYCVASDLPLSRADRYALGQDCHAILDGHLPGFVAAAAQRDWPLPSQVGRSVDSSKLQAAVGYRPRRSLARTAERWRAEASRTTMREEVTP